MPCRAEFFCLHLPKFALVIRKMLAAIYNFYNMEQMEASWSNIWPPLFVEFDAKTNTKVVWCSSSILRTN
jgi:hypothetical protein